MKRSLVTLAIMCLFSLPVSAATIYVAIGSGGGVIYALDSETGDASYVAGSFPGVAGWYDIAVDSNGNLYGLSSASLGSALYSIDPLTNTVEQIGVTGLSFGLSSLAFGADDILYGAGSSGFFELDVGTGEATLTGVVDTFFNAGFGDIVHAGGSTFYGLSILPCNGGTGSCLWRIDGNTGEGTVVGPTGLDFMTGLGFVDGVLFGLPRQDTGNGGSSSAYYLDTTDGSATLFSNFGNFAGILGAATAPATTVPIPAALPLMLSAILGLGWMRRRKPQYKK